MTNKLKLSYLRSVSVKVDYIQSIIVSVDYSDFLSITLKKNSPVLNKIVIVTIERDSQTRDIAAQFENVSVVLTNRLYENKSKFNKSNAINDGVPSLERKGYTIIMDSDIVLPSNFRHLIDNCALSEEKLYGCYRYMCRTYQDYFTRKDNPDTWRTLPKSGMFFRRGKMNIPGFFQMFHSKHLKEKLYPETSKDASGSDIQFSAMWPDNMKEILPGIEVLHLGENFNWWGRRSHNFKIPQK